MVVLLEANITDKMVRELIRLVYVPHHEKTCLQGLRLGKTQTSLLFYRS